MCIRRKRAYWYGSDSLLLSVDDLGNCGASRLAKTATETLAIVVVPQNDLPVIKVSSALELLIETAEDTPAAVPQITVSDVEAQALTVTLASDLGKGVISLGTHSVPSDQLLMLPTSTSSMLSMRGTISGLNEALKSLAYTPMAHRTGDDDLRIVVSDGVSGGLASLSVPVLIVAANT